MRLVSLIVLLVVTPFNASASDVSVAFQRLREAAIHIDIGSGSLVKAPSGKTYLLTNDHVCRFGKWKGEVLGRFPEGPSISGRIVKSDNTKDLCAVTVSPNDKALKIGSTLRSGQEVYTRGFPHGILTESEGKVGHADNWYYDYPIGEIGECPAEYKQVRDPYQGFLIACRAKYHSILTSLYGRPGSSGSAVVNSSGELVGVLSSWSPSNVYEAGMVSLEDVKEFFKDL
jgi:S1-C subfamily serine protease